MRYFSCICKLDNGMYGCTRNYEKSELFDNCVKTQWSNAESGIEYPFFNRPRKDSLEGLLAVKNSKFSSFLSSFYQTFLYGDEQFDIDVVESSEQLTNLEKHWLEKRRERYLGVAFYFDLLHVFEASKLGISEFLKRSLYRLF